MAYVITNNQHYINIADAIRDTSFGEIEGPLAPSEFAQRIGEISQIGQAAGAAEGYAQGLEEGKQVGIQSEYDRFWDIYQRNGERVDYRGAFNYGFTVENFRPKYDMNMETCRYAFEGFNKGCEPVSLKQLLADAGVSLTIASNVGVYESMFLEANITEVGELDFSGSPYKTQQYVFSMCKNLKTIDKLTFPVGQTTYHWFGSCNSLENLTIGGEIANNKLNLSWSPLLTHDSLMSVINALADKSEDTSGTAWAVTLGTENLAKLTESEIAIATQRGWTLA